MHTHSSICVNDVHACPPLTQMELHTQVEGACICARSSTCARAEGTSGWCLCSCAKLHSCECPLLTQVGLRIQTQVPFACASGASCANPSNLYSCDRSFMCMRLPISPWTGFEDPQVGDPCSTISQCVKGSPQNPQQWFMHTICSHTQEAVHFFSTLPNWREAVCIVSVLSL